MTKTNGRILKDLYKEYFRIGVACEKINERFTSHEIGNKDKEELMAEQFNSMTFGNELKPAYNMGFSSPEAREDYLPFVINPAAKDMLDWARAHKMPVRGHVMVWHSQCPKEIFCKNYEPVTFPTDPEVLKERPMMKMFEKLNPVCFVDKDILYARLKSYIFSLMEYMYENGYMDTIYAWDVVNEAIELADKTPTELRNSYWYMIGGEDFIYWAFRFAHDAVEEMSRKYAKLYGIDPTDEEALSTIKPVLFYNDYNEFQPEKKKAIIDMLTREGRGGAEGHTCHWSENHGSIIGEGLIGGIGMQGHLSDNNDLEEYDRALRDYASYVKEIHITELDVKCTSHGVNEEYYQAVFYKALFEKLIAAKKDNVNLTAVVFWGLTDDNSWIRGANPLLFRKDLSCKKSYDALCYALSGESLGEPQPVKYDLSDRLYDFSDERTPEELGFTMKGFGNFVLQKEVFHSGSAAIFNEHRFGDWSGVAFDVSDFVGQTIKVGAYVKSKAPTVILKADEGNEFPIVGSADTSSGEWAYLEGTYRVPASAHSMQLIFGTKEDKPDVFNGIYVDDVEIKSLGLLEGFEDKDNIAAIRGAGHLPLLMVTDKVAHGAIAPANTDSSAPTAAASTVSAPAKHSLMVTRQEKDATVKFDITPFVGHRIKFTAFVMAKDKEIRMGLDLTPPVLCASINTAEGTASENAAAEGTSSEKWNEISAVMDIPENLTSAYVYIETDGNKEYYVDDIKVTLCEK